MSSPKLKDGFGPNGAKSPLKKGQEELNRSLELEKMGFDNARNPGKAPNPNVPGTQEKVKKTKGEREKEKHENATRRLEEKDRALAAGHPESGVPQDVGGKG